MVQYYVSYSDGSVIPYNRFPMNRKVYHREFSEFEAFKGFQLEDGSVRLFINAIGVKPEDVSVSVESLESGHLLKVEGESEVEHLGTHSFSYSWPVKKIAKISKHFENGILTLTIEWEKPISPDVEIVEN